MIDKTRGFSALSANLGRIVGADATAINEVILYLDSGRAFRITSEPGPLSIPIISCEAIKRE